MFCFPCYLNVCFFNVIYKHLYPGTKEQLHKENEELKQQLEVRVTALKTQYEGRLRELRELRGHQDRQEQRDEPPEAGPSKVGVAVK